jgi:hypothetical protein
MEAGGSFGATVIKELIQNADDAEASELVVTLDERKPPALPLECGRYAPLLDPALIVRNDARFRIAGEIVAGKVVKEDEDDFTAIRKVAGGHKQLNPTAAGRFGIGFNSVYFLTDTPLLFSRRQVEIFDLRHLMGFSANGWQFSLDKFPAAASDAGTIKTILDWVLPKAVLAEGAFQDLANSGRDYRQTVFRLPLRRTLDTSPTDRGGPVFPYASFPDREELLRQMCDEARRSLLFLKSLRRVVFGGILERHFDEWARVEMSPQAPQGLNEFVKRVEAREDLPRYSFRCDVSVEAKSARVPVASGSASFLVTHSTDFKDQALTKLAEKLQKNGEKGMPWVSIAVPTDSLSFNWEGAGNARWRVFLPLIEEGPCTCILNAGLFVNPSRRAAEFQTEGSDETSRKTDWNRMLVEHCLVPLLRDASAQVIHHAPDLVMQEPKKYLSLFPTAWNSSSKATCLADIVRSAFSRDLWLLKLFDLWKRPFDVLIGPDGPPLQMESIRDWLSLYSSAYEELTTESRRFLDWRIADALRERLGKEGNVDIREPSPDVADRVLLSQLAPKSTDLKRLLSLLGEHEPLEPSTLEGRWAFQSAAKDQPLLRFEKGTFYLVRTDETPPIYDALGAIGISFGNAAWVVPDVGLTDLRLDLCKDLYNLRNADDEAVLELLCRVGAENHHDLLSDHHRIVPIVDFLCSQNPNRLAEDLRLAFMVKTAPGKLDRRHLGIMFLRPEKQTSDEEDLWQGLLREAFAEVDPQFARELRRAIEHAPHILTCFGEEGCNIRLARGDLLDTLHDVCMGDETFLQRLAEQLNVPHLGKPECSPEVYRAARLLLREADRRWDTLDEPHRVRVLALPIHRTASGRMISLCSEGDCTPAQVKDRHFLQSQDDLRDAPLELPVGQLLHSLDPDIRSFYRRRLEMRVQDRTEVLKGCLRQIGVDETHNSLGILQYVARYYTETLQRLRDVGGEGTRDLRELEELHGAARGVPCLDGAWHCATQCVDAADLFRLLSRQGWREEHARAIICHLCYPRPAADTWSEEGKLALTLWNVERLDRDRLTELAIRSDSPNLSLKIRMKVIHDNLTLVPPVPTRRATWLDKEVCAAIAGPIELEKLIVLEVSQVELNDQVVRVILPEAADLPQIGRDLVEGEVDLVAAAAVLRALNVPAVKSVDLLERVLANFAGVWTQLGSDARIDLLSWFARQKSTLPAQAVNLDTVLVGEERGEWVRPGKVIAPRWVRSSPPSLPSARIPRTRGISSEVLQLWNEWCGICNLNDIVDAVVQATCELPRNRWPEASGQLGDWLDRLATQHGAQTVADAIQHLQWMLSRRDNQLEFHRASVVLDHPGAEVLQQKFWVIQGKMPRSLSGLVETHRLSGTPETLGLIASCLASATRAHPKATESVYMLLADIVSDESAAETWHRLALSQPVYRLFRNPDRVVSGEELFVGEAGQSEDFGSLLHCFGTGDDSKRHIRHLYRKLGVAVHPTASQLVSALTRLSGGGRAVDTIHYRLVDVLTQMTVEPGDFAPDQIRKMKIRSCAGNYAPLSRCYRDPELDRPSRVFPHCHDLMIDGRESISANRKLIRWLDENFPGAVQDLRAKSVESLAREPEEVGRGISSNVLNAWDQWLNDLATPGSLVRQKVEELGFAVTAQAVRLKVVRKIEVNFTFDDGSILVPADEWRGPELLADSRAGLLVRSDTVDRDFVGQPAEVDRLDDRITDHVENLLRRSSAAARPSQPLSGSLREVVRSTLERPGGVLTRMKEEKEDNFFYQYFDQTADPDFSSMFDVYRRTSKAAEGIRSSLRDKMWDIIRQRFIEARRDQIRGYGYDEFAIFAELVQNAEDAYAQREPLCLPDPPSRSVTFSYASDHGGRTLTASHYGRPFNMWRNGARHFENYRHDVEGVLKSAGSFKPHAKDGCGRPIGRFGLGFKSVYLVTDAPRIHSGDWHFEITAGCIPKELPVPAGYAKDLTKIVLPLTPDVVEQSDGKSGRYANLVPFLRQIAELCVQHSDGSSLSLRVTTKGVLRTSDEHMVDLVEIAGAQHTPEGSIRILRVRHPDHEGQLGVLLASDGLPVAWTEVFDSDVFAMLPLRVKLGCGVGVSNLFEVQSGRTHLIDPAANKSRISEVAQSLGAAAKALMADNAASPGEIMSRFWSLWRWDRGDEEARDLRLQLAKELVGLAKTAPIVPTLDRARCVTLGGEVLFSFESIPQGFANDLLQKSVEIIVDDKRVKIHKGNVIPELIRSVCERAREAAGESNPLQITSVGWSQLGQVLLSQPWLADRPELVSAMARSIAPGRIDEIRQWLSKCLFRSAAGRSMQLADLLPQRFPGLHHLPSRLLDLLHESYDDAAVSLLKQVGLPSRPALERVKAWVCSDLSQSECCGLLHYLSEAGRWRRDYYDLGPLLNSPWFEADGARLTTAIAFEQGLVSLEELDTDPAFRAWLGINAGEVHIHVESDRWDRPVPDPQNSLISIYKWWVRDRDRLVHRYEERTYPGGTPPLINQNFSDRNSLQRHSWLSLLILASMHTMGRSNPEQHRGFLRQCERLGWMDVFADPKFPADNWIRVLEDYLNSQMNDNPFYHWVRQYVSIYQIARWLPEYVASFLAIDRFKEPFDLDRVTKPAVSQDFSGGGPSAPPLTRALGIGACFVVRELVRADVLRSPLAYDHAYVAVGRVRYVLARLGLADLRSESASYQQSPRIHNFLCDHLGADRAHYERCFDLPFLAIAEDAELQRRFLQCELPLEYEETP